MNILKNKQNRSGIISLIFLLLSFVLFVVNAITISASGSVTLILLEPLCLFLAFVFALIGIVKAIKNKKGFLICVPGLALPLLHFCVSFAVFFAEIRPLLNYTDEYVYDSDRNKIEYDLLYGCFEYGRLDIFVPCYEGAYGNYYYTVHLSGLNGEPLPLPHCDWLNLDGENPMIGISGFCDYYHYYVEEDEANHRTVIYQLSDRLILPWGKYTAYYEKSGEEISLNFPIVHRDRGDCHTNESGSETFVDTDLLYYAGFLRLYDEKACKDFYDYLGTKWEIIEKNGEKINGEYYYKGNKISGAALYFYNNELFEDSVVKIGMSVDEAAAIFGPSYKTNLKNHLNYWYFDMRYDENDLITEIHLCYD